MNRIPLFTSIPPRLSRRDSQDREIGPEYLEACVSSWLKSGFAPVSVNSASEKVGSLPGVEFVTVPRDASSIAGKPLVYFHDLLGAAARVGNGPVAIVNADILLEPTFDLSDLVRSILPGQALMAQRIDIESLDERNGQPYKWGFDFFAAHTRDLQQLPDFSLIFGAPWWDYYLPIMLYSTGTKVGLLRQPFAYHLTHTERYQKRLWASIGAQYVKSLRRALAVADTKEATEFLTRVEQALRNTSSHKADRAWSRVKHRLPFLSSTRSRALLRYLGQETLQFIDQHC